MYRQINILNNAGRKIFKLDMFKIRQSHDQPPDGQEPHDLGTLLGVLEPIVRVVITVLGYHQE